MSKELVLKVLGDNVNQQQMAIAGGIVGGPEEEAFAKQDLKDFKKALKYAEKNLK